MLNKNLIFRIMPYLPKENKSLIMWNHSFNIWIFTSFMYYFGQWWVGCLTYCLLDGKQSGLLHGNQHQASPWQGHTRLTREKHREFQMNHRRSRQVEQVSCQTSPANPQTLKEETYPLRFVKMPLPVSPNAVFSGFPREGERRTICLFFMAWMFLSSCFYISLSY